MAKREYYADGSDRRQMRIAASIIKWLTILTTVGITIVAVGVALLALWHSVGWPFPCSAMAFVDYISCIMRIEIWGK